MDTTVCSLCDQEYTRTFTCGGCKWSRNFCGKHAPDKDCNCKCEKSKPKMTWRTGHEPQPKKKLVPPSSSVVQRISETSERIDVSSPIGSSSTKQVKVCLTEICPSCEVEVDLVMTHAAFENLKEEGKYVPSDSKTKKPLCPSKIEFERARQKMGSAKAHCIIGQTELRNGARRLIKEFLRDCPEKKRLS